jgi:hypothetical protein
MQGLTVEDWLPQNLADEFSGAVQGAALRIAAGRRRGAMGTQAKAGRTRHAQILRRAG